VQCIYNIPMPYKKKTTLKKGGNRLGTTGDFAQQVYGNGDQQVARSADDNVIAMSGGSTIPLAPQQFPNDALLHPSQSEIVTNDHTSAHSATDALSTTIKGGAGITEMLVPVSIVALYQAMKKYKKGVSKMTLKKGGNAGFDDQKMMGMMDENNKMMAQTQCQQAGYPAQISNAPYGSSIAVASVDCNTTLSGGGYRKRKNRKSKRTAKRTSKRTSKRAGKRKSFRKSFRKTKK